MNKKLFLPALLLIGLICFNLYSYYHSSNAATNQLSTFSISGDCTSGISNLYISEEGSWNATFSQYQFTTIPKNTTVNNYDMDLVAVKIKVIHMRDPSYNFIVTDNASDPNFAVPETVFDTPKARMAQYFKLNNLTYMGDLWIYLNASIGGILPKGHFQIDFYNASDFAGGPINDKIFNLTKSVSVLGWESFTINTYFEPGEYFAVFSSWITAFLNPAMNNNSWYINDNLGPEDAKGPSLFENSSGWFNIPGDTTADFLMYFQATHFCDPRSVNLSAVIEGNPVEFHHKKDPSVKHMSVLGPIILAKPKWTSEITYYLSALPNAAINISISINRTIAAGSVETRGRYYYEEATTGTFSANLSSIQWDVDYRKVNSSLSLLVFFRYPDDWHTNNFYDRSFGVQIFEYGIFYSYIYGDYGNGIWYEELGDGTQTFYYSASFTSPNYLSKTELLTKSLLSADFTKASESYLGDPLKIQVTIKNTDGDLITDGNCSFYLYNSNGEKVLSNNKTNTNGVVTSDEINTNNLALGTYSMVVVWTNGEEFGLTVYEITVGISPILVTIIIAVAVAAGTVVALTYGRRKIAERNWVKSLHHLLVLSKDDGRPMYNYSFGIAIKDTALISGMLSALSNFVRETTGSKKSLRVIDQEDKKVILSHGELASVIILSGKNLSIIRNRATEFLNEFEAKYRGKLMKWTGDTSLFKGASQIVEEHFPISMEQKLINKCGEELHELKALLESADDKSTVTEILTKTTKLTEIYHDIILKNYNDVINEIIKTANKKLE